MDLRTTAGFDWDDGNRTKCQKHGVSLAEIEAVFDDRSVYLPDAAHSWHEERLIAVGTAGQARPIFVVFTLRTVGNRRLVRPISARYMHREEVDDYAKAFPAADER